MVQGYANTVVKWATDGRRARRGERRGQRLCLACRVTPGGHYFFTRAAISFWCEALGVELPPALQATPTLASFQPTLATRASSADDEATAAR